MSADANASDRPGGPGSADGIDLSVVAGSPTPEDIAAVTAVLRAAADAAAARGRTVVSVDPRAGWEAASRSPRTMPSGAASTWSRSLR
ncbi:acyl-CoA carboxylase epsilon subunit [Curtobacterium sp. MCBD17_019]|uniref:acyl-CoA carboxylase epsilon subunit n=1 Tax=Curtobacterium sp. MCBD17_019 TaxID=2175669 RepID=UPI000DA95D6E|nr:acyl-CoA carboxylase epsilon subunit [Curtobacterium sp. MCBD17_019]PZE75091.1 acyl-CoA carboxylase subunit epsilon [Curtobacterium sp. MCBD17_019]